VQQALSQLAEWGNLRAQADTARVASLEDFYRARFLYSLSQGGEAVEAALETFAATIARRAELQSTALEDILARLEGLRLLAAEATPDEAKVHEVLRDLSQRLSGLAANAQAFMADVTRRIELQRADVQAVMGFKNRLIDYLQRFIADLVAQSPRIAQRLIGLQPPPWQVAGREAYVCENPTIVAVAADRLGRRCAPLICTEGMPSASQRMLWRQFQARPWRFGADDYRDAASIAGCPLEAPVPAALWDERLAPAMRERGQAVHEEAVAETLLQELRLPA